VDARPQEVVRRLAGLLGGDVLAVRPGEGYRELRRDGRGARYGAVHLEESLATREPHGSGCWTYRAGFFHPEPPWEAHRRRRDAEGAGPA